MKLFAVVGSASRRESVPGINNAWRDVTRNLLSLAEARSLEEAEGIALRGIRDDAPQEEGWEKHSGLVLEIPQDLIDKYATIKHSS
jgi:hypothetical protein